jgi:hypothetical protein
MAATFRWISLDVAIQTNARSAVVIGNEGVDAGDQLRGAGE